jgi:hypothetical protein
MNKKSAVVRTESDADHPQYGCTKPWQKQCKAAMRIIRKTRNRSQDLLTLEKKGKELPGLLHQSLRKEYGTDVAL